jgi:hypothetical protein
MLTRFQIHERLGSLSGEIKAAREMKRETEKALTDADKAVALARQADDKAQAHIDRLEAEAKDLGQQYLDAVDQLIAGAPVADETAPNVPVEFVSTDTIVEGLGGVEGADFAFDTPERHADAFRVGEVPSFERSIYTGAINDAFERATNP